MVSSVGNFLGGAAQFPANVTRQQKEGEEKKKKVMNISPPYPAKVLFHCEIFSRVVRTPPCHILGQSAPDI